MTALSSSEGIATALFDTTPTTRQAVLDKYAAWRAGQVVSSEVAAVGRLSLGPLEETLVFGARILDTPYTMLTDGSNIANRLRRLRTAFLGMVAADTEACGLAVHKIEDRIFAGNYEGRNREPWHSDDHRSPSVRYTVGLGQVGSTRFAVGTICNTDIQTNNVDGGDLLPNIVVGPGGQLEEIEVYPAGTVLRFMNVADIHAGPIGTGARVMLQATVHL